MAQPVALPSEVAPVIILQSSPTPSIASQVEGRLRTSESLSSIEKSVVVIDRNAVESNPNCIGISKRHLSIIMAIVGAFLFAVGVIMTLSIISRPLAEIFFLNYSHGAAIVGLKDAGRTFVAAIGFLLSGVALGSLGTGMLISDQSRT